MSVGSDNDRNYAHNNSCRTRFSAQENREVEREKEKKKSPCRLVSVPNKNIPQKSLSELQQGRMNTNAIFFQYTYLTNIHFKSSSKSEDTFINADMKTSFVRITISPTPLSLPFSPSSSSLSSSPLVHLSLLLLPLFVLFLLPSLSVYTELTSQVSCPLRRSYSMLQHTGFCRLSLITTSLSLFVYLDFAFQWFCKECRLDAMYIFPVCFLVL